MIIQGTAKMLAELGIRCRWLSHIGKREYPAGLFDWHANTVDFGGRTGIVLMNNLTMYPVVILTNQMFDQELFLEYIIQAFRSEGIHEAVLACYRMNAGMVLIDKTSDRGMVQRLKNVCNEVQKCMHLLEEGTCLQTKLGREAARKRLHYADGSYAAASERMFKMLERLKTDAEINVPLLDLEVLDLLIRLEIPKTRIEVRIHVPANITVSLFHELVVKMFDWSAQGEHAFFCGEEQICERCELGEINWTQDIRYEYWMPGYHRWEHLVRLVNRKTHQHSDNVYAMECRGRRPPWVLDGPDAYAAYQRSLSDYRDPGYEEAQKLHNRYGAKPLSLREMNMELRWIMVR